MYVYMYMYMLYIHVGYVILIWLLINPGTSSQSEGYSSKWLTYMYIASVWGTPAYIHVHTCNCID